MSFLLAHLFSFQNFLLTCLILTFFPSLPCAVNAHGVLIALLYILALLYSGWICDWVLANRTLSSIFYHSCLLPFWTLFFPFHGKLVAMWWDENKPISLLTHNIKKSPILPLHLKEKQTGCVKPLKLYSLCVTTTNLGLNFLWNTFHSSSTEAFEGIIKKR